MRSRSIETVAAAAVIVIGLVGSIFLTGYAESVRPAMPAGYEDGDLGLEGSRFKGFVLGAEGLVADWYWMNSLQYMGNKIQSAGGLNNLDLDDLRPLNPRLLYPYLNNAADLDPHFMAPYSYGATVLPAIEPGHAIALTEKGISNNPDNWRLQQYLGYIYWRLGDYEKASEVYRQGSLVEGAPVFLKMMAARMKTEGGSRDTAREMYRQILTESEDDISRQSAELRMLQIDSLDERDLLDPALREYRERTGHCADKWSDVFSLLRDKRLPSGAGLRVDAERNIVDPSGAPYVIDPQKCAATIDSGRSRVPPA